MEAQIYLLADAIVAYKVYDMALFYNICTPVSRVQALAMGSFPWHLSDRDIQARGVSNSGASFNLQSHHRLDRIVSSLVPPEL